MKPEIQQVSIDGNLHPEDGGDMLIQNVAIHQKDYMVQQPRGPLFTTTPL
jgi:hypothetical protein